MLLSDFLVALLPVKGGIRPFHSAVSGRTAGRALVLPEAVATNLEQLREAAVEESARYYTRLLQYADALHHILEHDMLVPLVDGKEPLRFIYMHDRTKRKAYHTLTGEYILTRIAIASRILDHVPFDGHTLQVARRKDPQGARAIRSAAQQIQICSQALNAANLPSSVVAERRLACGIDPRISFDTLYLMLLMFADTMEGVLPPAAQLKRWNLFIAESETFPLKEECEKAVERAILLTAFDVAQSLGGLAMKLTKPGASSKETRDIREYVRTATVIYRAIGEQDAPLTLQRYCRAHLGESLESEASDEEKRVLSLKEIEMDYLAQYLETVEATRYPPLSNSLNITPVELAIATEDAEEMEAEPEKPVVETKHWPEFFELFRKAGALFQRTPSQSKAVPTPPPSPRAEAPAPPQVVTAETKAEELAPDARDEPVRISATLFI